MSQLFYLHVNTAKARLRKVGLFGTEYTNALMVTDRDGNRIDCIFFDPSSDPVMIPAAELQKVIKTYVQHQR